MKGKCESVKPRTSQVSQEARCQDSNKARPFIQSSHVRLEDDDELAAQWPYYIVAVRVDGFPITMC